MLTLPFTSMVAKLANEGRKVTNVFETPNAFLAAPVALPAFILKSRLRPMCLHFQLHYVQLLCRFMAIFSLHIQLSHLERVRSSGLPWRCFTSCGRLWIWRRI